MVWEGHVIYKILMWIFLGAVLVLGVEVVYQNVVIENQRVQIQGLVEHGLQEQ